MNSLLNFVGLFRKLLCVFFYTIICLLPFTAQSNTAEDYEKALISFNQEEFRESYIHLKNALQQSPGHLPSKLLIGRIFLIDGYPDAAITEFEEVAQAGADINLVILPLANAYLMKGQYQKVIDLKIPVNANQATQLDIYLLKANAHIQQNNYLLAEQHFQNAKEKFGSDIRIVNGLAQMSLLKKDLAKAKVIIAQALKVTPQNAQSRLINGLIYQAEGKRSEALLEFEKAYEGASSDPAIKRALANSYAQAGNIPKANELVAEIEIQSPGSLQNKLLKARLLAMSEKNEAANLVLTELSQTLSTLNKADNQYISKVSLVAGITAHINQNYDVSVRELSRYLKNEEASAELVAMLAEAYIRTQDNKAASQLLERYENLILNNIQIASLSCELYLSSSNIFKCDSLIKKLKERHGATTGLVLLEARLLNSRKRPQEALSLLQNKLANSDNVDVVLFRAGLLANLGKYDESLTDAQTLLATLPNELTYLNLNVDILIRLQEFEQAETLLQKVLQQAPDNLAGLIHQSRILFALTDLQGANASIQKALTIDKANFSALLLNGQILVKQGQLDDATNQLIAAKTVNSISTSPRELLVSIHKQQNNFELALSELNQLLKLHPSEPEYINEKAKLYITLKQPEKAKRELDMLFFQWSKQPRKLVQLSRLQLENNDIEGAESSLVAAQQQAPSNLIVQLEYAKLLLTKKEFLQADRYISKMESSFPNDANVNLIRGHYFKEKRELENAYSSYYKAYSLAENFTAALIELYKLASQGIHSSDIKSLFNNQVKSQPEAHFTRHLYADLLYLEQDMLQASTHYEKLITVDGLPNKANIYNNLANIMSDTDLDKAISYAKQAINLNPNSSSILDTQGWLYTKNNNPQQGLNILRQAFTIDSENPTIRYHLAYTLNKLDRVKEAKSELVLALRSKQYFKEREQAQALLSTL